MDGFLLPDQPGTWKEGAQIAGLGAGVNLVGSAGIRALVEPGSSLGRYAPLLIGVLQLAAGLLLKRPVIGATGLGVGLVVVSTERLLELQAERLVTGRT